VNYFYIALFALLACGCQSDVSIVDQKETRVIVDSFIQTDRLEELDVLVVLDTSGSMMDNYDDVADGMDILRQDIESLTLDYRFGYTTMDKNNLSYIGPYDSSSTAIDMLMAPSLLPTTSLEEGFAATYSFFTSLDPYEFRRPDADFLLFLISDEDEQSAISASLFYEWMHSEFQDVSHDVVCVVNPDDGSESSWAYEVGFKYIELADLYEKDVVDLQAEDWSVWLSESSYLTRQMDYIALSEADPILESLTVYINSQTTSDWQYNEKTNTIQLGFLPDYGALVEVGYKIYI